MCSTLDKATPLTIKLPLNIKSPFFFVTGSDSPVMKDSLTSTSPFRINASHTTWWPLLSFTISSRTISSTFFSCSFPSLITVTLDSERSDNLSIIFFDIISSTILMKELTNIIPINKQF